MPLYEMTNDEFRPISPASFSVLNIRERDDLQRLLRAQIDVLGEPLFILSEEFGEWEDSRRRIDLLAVDQQANLVVIELKRTTDGGHMDLQAIRYASMVSAMTFERAEQIHADFLGRFGGSAEDARSRLLDFLGWEEPDEESFAPDVRIILASENFSKELTTAVLWLRDRDIDIRCVRLCPYADGDRRLIDVQQIIPLPEAHEYQVQLRQKEKVEREKRAEQKNAFQEFWQGIVAMAGKHRTRHANIKPSAKQWLAAGSGLPGFSFNYVIGKEHNIVEIYIDRGDTDENKQLFDQLNAQRTEIETRFGGTLSWERLDHRKACRIKYLDESGGYRSPEQEWPAIQTKMVDRMTKFEAALLPALQGVVIPEKS